MSGKRGNEEGRHLVSKPAREPTSAESISESAEAKDKPYIPTPHESAAAQRYLDRRKQRGAAPRFRVQQRGNSVSIDPDHPKPICAHAAVADMLCTSDSGFSSGILGQLANIACTGSKLTAKELNFTLAMVKEIGPRDPTEALLACQMAAIHNATMIAARRLNHSERIDQQDSNSNSLNKLARTFAAQVETLKKYRSTGEQTVRVTHQQVNVTAGQAIVGISQGGGGAHENTSQSHALDSAEGASAPDARGPSLLGQEQALGAPLPSANCEGAESVPHARRASRSAEGKSQRSLAPRDGDRRCDRAAPGAVEADA